MRTVRLPETHATRLHLECVSEDGETYCIQTKAHCGCLQVPDSVVNIRVTPIDEHGNPVDMGQVMCIRQSVEYSVVR